MRRGSERGRCPSHNFWAECLWGQAELDMNSRERRTRRSPGRLRKFGANCGAWLVWGIACGTNVSAGTELLTTMSCESPRTAAAFWSAREGFAVPQPLLLASGPKLLALAPNENVAGEKGLLVEGNREAACEVDAELFEQETGQQETLPQETTSDAAGKKNTSVERVAADRAAEALEFLNQNHPQLQRLMNTLQEKRPIQYERAVQALVREVERLRAIEKREPERYPIALNLWKNQKSTEFVAAQMVMANQDAPVLRRRLLQLLREQRELQLKNLEFEISKTEQRLEGLRKNQAELQSAGENLEQEKLRQILGRAKRIKGGAESGNSKRGNGRGSDTEDRGRDGESSTIDQSSAAVDKDSR